MHNEDVPTAGFSLNVLDLIKPWPVSHSYISFVFWGVCLLRKTGFRTQCYNTKEASEQC